MAVPDLADDFQASTAGRAEVLADIRAWLNLDLTVIRGGWKLPATFEQARKEYDSETCSWHGGKENEPSYKRIRAAFDEQLALASDSLHDFIAQQNKPLADKLSAEDLHSLVRLGHVTLRGASTQPVSDVVVFDPIEDGAAPDRDWALGQLVNQGRFADAWSEDKATKMEKLRVADFIENFDINPLDLYAHRVLLRVHYALRHENQLMNMHGRLDEGFSRPHHLSFAKQTEYEYPVEYSPYQGQREYKAEEQTAAEVDAFHYLNRYDPDRDKSRKPAFGHDDDFYANMVRIEAISCIFPISFGDGTETVLRRFIGEPSRGWMRYYAPAGEEIGRDVLSKEQTEAIGKDLTQKIIAALKEDRPEEGAASFNIGRAFDLRTLIPAFRKVYEADQSKGTERALLNIIHEGLEKYFPALLESPMPGWTKDWEPPKNVDEYKKLQEEREQARRLLHPVKFKTPSNGSG